MTGMLVEIILVVCLLASPDRCEEQRPPIDRLSLVGCLSDGQLIAIEWLNEHPKWRLAGWRCRIGPRVTES